MRELRIFDSWTKDNRLLVPLSALLRLLWEICPEKLRGEWRIVRGAYGHGERVCEIEDALTDAEFVTVDGRLLLYLLAEEGEYFDNVRMQVPSSGMEVGVHDSTFLFLIADENVVQDIGTKFLATEVVDRAWSPQRPRGATGR